MRSGLAGTPRQVWRDASDARRKLRVTLLALAGVVVGGASGYRFIEGWSWLESFWMVGITLTTIGYGEVRPLSDAGRLYTLALVVCGLSLGSYTAAWLTRYVVEGDWARDLRRRRRERMVRELSGHFLVVGYGRVGREVAADLVHHGQQVAVIDVDPEKVERAHAEGMTALVGDATDDDMLLLVGVERARGMAVATGSHAVNVLVTLSARQLNPRLRILTRVDDAQTATKALRAGASQVVSPLGIGGEHMAQALVRPQARSFLDMALSRSYGELAIDDVEIGEESAICGTLGELALPARLRVMVVGVRKADGRLVAPPGPETRLGPGDTAIVVGRPEDIQAFAREACEC